MLCNNACFPNKRRRSGRRAARNLLAMQRRTPYFRRKRPIPPRRHPGRRRDPPGSDLWSGGSGCTISPSTPASVQTRAAPKRRRVGLRTRSGEEAAQPPGCVCEAVWKPHCGRRHPGRGRDPPGSDLWSGGSGCTIILPTPASVQTRAALKRRKVGLRARSGEEAAQPPGCVREAERKRHSRRVDTREAVWKPHCGRRHSGKRRDPPGFDLWSGGSGCTISLSAPASVQTRAALKRRGVGLRARSGEEAAQPPG